MLSPEATLVKLVNKSLDKAAELFKIFFFQARNRLPQPVSRIQGLLLALIGLRPFKKFETRTPLNGAAATYCLLQLCQQF